nr:Mur ligase family, glutamate ligase domain protein [uncultured bacterium]
MTQIPAQKSGWPVVGNERTVAMLRNALRSGNLPHAYLFVGPEGVGKRTMALAFAMSLNCQAEPPSGQEHPDVPCGICPSCSKILRGVHPDLMEVNLQKQAQMAGDGRSKSGPAKELKIDIIRDMQSTVGLSPHSARYKIYVIGDADRMNEEASNCLLKTLEEPPPNTMLFLLASDESAVLPTISSRCFIVPVRTVPTPVVAQALEDYWGAEREQAQVLATLSGGRLGSAVGLLEDRESLNRRKRALEELSLLAGAPLSDRVNVATRLARMFTDARPELYEMLSTWEGWWRDVMVTSSSAADLAVNIDQLAALRSVASKQGTARAARAVALIQETRKQLQENVNPRLALEALAIGLP